MSRTVSIYLWGFLIGVFIGQIQKGDVIGALIITTMGYAGFRLIAGLKCLTQD